MAVSSIIEVLAQHQDKYYPGARKPVDNPATNGANVACDKHADEGLGVSEETACNTEGDV